MKKVLLSSALFLISFVGFSQTKGISYQAVIIDPNPIQIPGSDITAQPYVSKDVWIRFGINAGTTLQYEELHKTKTDDYGLVNLIIGAGVNTGRAGTFTSLSWDGVTKNIITNVSFDQGGRYTEVSNQKLSYVPYTLLAETAVKLAGVLPIASGGTGATNAIAARTNLGLGNVDNTADADKPVSIATLAILDSKEAIANKSANIIADSASSVKYPSVKAIKDYVDARTSSANNANLAAKATALETPRTINGVPFDGTTNITIPVGVTPPDANATTKGLVQLAGDLTGTAAAPAIAAAAVSTAKIADGAVTTGKLAASAVNTVQVADGAITNAKITSVAGSKVTGDIAGNAANVSGMIAVANGGTGATTAAGALVNLGAEAIANKSTDLTVDANSTTKYPSVKLIKEYVDLRVASAAVNDGTITSAKITDATIVSTDIASNAGITNGQLANSSLTLGSTNVALGATTSTLAGLSSVTATNFSGALIGNASTATKLAATKNINGVAFDGSSDITVTADATTLSGVVPILNGGTGATTAAGARTNLGLGTLATNSTIVDADVDANAAIQDTKLATISTSGKVSNSATTATTASTSNSIVLRDVYGSFAAGEITAAGLNSSGNINVNGIKIGTPGGASNIGISDAAFTWASPVGNGNTVLGNYAFTSSSGSSNTAIGHNSIRQGSGGSGNNNTAVGAASLSNGQAANNNTAIGAETLASSTGTDNTALGYYSGRGITTGTKNTFLGSNADASANNLENATAIGYGAIVDGSNRIQLGNANVTSVVTSGTISATGFTGPLTGNAATATKLAATKTINGVAFDGSANITVPADATTLTGVVPIAKGGTGSSTQNFVDLTTNQTIAGTKTFSGDAYINGLRIGLGTGSGNYIQNTAFGKDALIRNTTGEGNAAIGYGAQYKGTTASGNTSLGFAALAENTTGGGNVALGYQALQKNIGGSNIAIGFNAMYLSQNSNNNIVLGANAMDWSTNGANDNIVLGVNALRFATTAANNIVIGNGIGYNTLPYFTTETNNILIGTNANIGVAGITNSTALGYGAVVNASNRIQLGNANVTSVVTSGTISATGFTGSLTGNASTATKLAATKTINGVAFDGSADITIAANSNTLTGTTLASTITGSSLTSVGTITSGIWSATTIDIAKGGTGATTAAAALTNLGAEAIANKSISITTDAASDDKYPSVKSVKSYVDGQLASGGVADGSITNAKLAGSITSSKLVGTDITTVGTITAGTWSASVIDIAHGGTGSSTVTGAKTNLGLNNVENTALSTWTGSTNITTVGALTAQTKTFMFQDLILGYGANNQAKIQTDASNKYLSFYPNYNVESTRMWPSGNVTIQTGGTFTDNGYKLEVAGTSKFTGNASIVGNLDVTGNITSATWSGTTIPLTKGGTGATTAADARTNLGLVIGTDVMAANYTTTLTGDVTGAGNGSFATTLAASGVTSGNYGSSTAIPTFTVDSKGRLTAAGTVGITAGVSTLAYSTTGSSNGGTISGTTLTLTAADASNPGLISTGVQTIAGAKTFSNTTTFNTDITVNGLKVGRGAGAVASNAALGATALNANTTGNYNVAVGSEALQRNTAGSVNVALGAATIDYLTSGNNNTVIGGFAGRNYGSAGTGTVATMNNGILLGYDARPLADAGTDEVVIGMRAIGHGSNTVTLGNSNNTKTYINGDLSLTGNITSGIWSATEVAIAKGGTGATTASGARTNLGLGSLATKSAIVNADVDASAAIAFSKLNITRADISGLGIQDGLTAGSGISLSSGTISVTGLTTSNLASNAAITNGQLVNSTTILGNTTMTLGGTVTSVTGLVSVTSTGFTGALTGNASTATKLAATKNINGIAFDGSADITIAANANTLTGTTLASNVVTSSLSSVATITSGVWNGSTIAVAYGGTGSTTKNFVDLTTDQTVAGAKTLSSDLTVNGIKIGKGAGNSGANTVLGSGALLANSTGGGLIAIGPNALANNTTANNNIAIGYDAQKENTTGLDNLGVGVLALKTNISGGRNVALGNYSLQNSTGENNSAVGVSSLNSNSTGVDNTAIGYNSLQANTTGSNNVGIGVVAGANNTTGGYNISIGKQAMQQNTSGSSNIALGAGAIDYMTSGDFNTVLGNFAGRYFGSGNSNNTTAMSNSILIGYDTRPKLNSGSNEIVIGNSATGNGNNTVTIGNTNNTKTFLTGDLSVSGTITSGTWSGTTIAVANGGTGTTTSTGSGSLVLNTSPTLVTPVIGVATGTSLTLNSGLSASNATISGTITASAFVGDGSGLTNVNGTSISDNVVTSAKIVDATIVNADISGSAAIAYSKLNLASSVTNSDLAGSISDTKLATISTALKVSNSATTAAAANTANAIVARDASGNFTANIITGTLSGTATNVTGIVDIINGGTGSSTKNFVDLTTAQTVAGAKTLSGITTLSNASTSTSTSTGSLVVSGGVGIAGAVYAGSIQNTPVGSTTASTGAFTTLAASGASNLAGTLGVTGVTTLSTLTTTGAATISSTTTSTSSSSGALIVRGGVGIAGALNVGGNTVLTGTIEIDGGSPGAGKVLISDTNGLASWSNAVGSTVLTSTTTYAITLAEAYVFYNGSSAGAFTIPAAASTNAGKAITIKNKTAFGITITPSSTGNIYIDKDNTAANTVSIGVEASNNWIKLVSDGTQWNVIRALF